MMNKYAVDEAMKAKMEQAAQCGAMGARVTDEPMREGFRDRLQSRLARTRREAHKSAQIDELLFLLDKHPEVARILELVEAVGQ